ncbi:MAG: hypothetical protein ACR2PT_14030 [Endozoicomonas sp.]
MQNQIRLAAVFILFVASLSTPAHSTSIPRGTLEALSARIEQILAKLQELERQLKARPAEKPTMQALDEGLGWINNLVSRKVLVPTSGSANFADLGHLSVQVYPALQKTQTAANALFKQDIDPLLTELQELNSEFQDPDFVSTGHNVATNINLLFHSMVGSPEYFASVATVEGIAVQIETYRFLLILIKFRVEKALKDMSS